MKKAIRIVKICVSIIAALLLLLASNLPGKIPVSFIQPFFLDISNHINSHSVFYFMLLAWLFVIWIILGFFKASNMESQLEKGISDLTDREKVFEQDASRQFQSLSEQRHRLEIRFTGKNEALEVREREAFTFVRSNFSSVKNALQENRREYYLTNKRLYSIAQKSGMQMEDTIKILVKECQETKCL